MADKYIKWEVLTSGQVGEYKDSIYEFEIESNLPPAEVKRFCLDFLSSAENEVTSGTFDGACGFPFGLETYYMFSLMAEGNYKYVVCKPYTG